MKNKHNKTQQPVTMYGIYSDSESNKETFEKLWYLWENLNTG